MNQQELEAHDAALEKAARLCYEEGVEYAIPTIGTMFPAEWHTMYTRRELARQIRKLKFGAFE